MLDRSIKKLTTLFLCISGSVYCQSNIIRNTTYGEITVHVEYANPNMCPPVSITVPRYRTKAFDVQQTCCARKVTILRPGTDQSYEIDLSPVDANKTCSRFEIRVSIAFGNILAAELHYF